ncbi:sporulation histidine kinase inhibitor Sda [Paenibacillus thalictri]|uniref:Sporulation histidine kinase inhibitor Sda n=1 Tax=Paenibacillus thalictri TaxID=2527873 RepID=A0A4Q9DII7_9BACL|nr:sporulation histidine kinase inhibitor Sda [Paenibacillus thalictri]TBL71515.1 sporulation histidine kinase inhibitor Sda [Paenibacillus thalictri]
MRMISNEVLIDSYFKAIDLKLEDEFIKLLMDEIIRRQLKVSFDQSKAQVS